jgi:hypothetical protein
MATPAAGGKVREALWFEKGDVDQMVAEARRRVEAARAKAIVDDGSVTADDRTTSSLGSVGTSTALRTIGVSGPGELVSNAELMREVGRGRRRRLMTVVALAIAVIGLSIAFIRHRAAKTIYGGDMATDIVPPPPPTVDIRPANPSIVQTPDDARKVEGPRPSKKSTSPSHRHRPANARAIDGDRLREGIPTRE